MKGETKPPHPQHQTLGFPKTLLQTVLSAPETSPVPDKAAGELFHFNRLLSLFK